MSQFDLEQVKGIIVPLLTPVDKEENIDEEKLRFIVEHVIEGGVHEILAFGSNSEFYMFDNDEMIDATKIILDQTKGRVPVYFGMGAIRTKHGIELAKRAAELDVAAISILQPMFIKPTEEGLYNHFKDIAEAVPNKMVLLYNNPARCGYSMSQDVIQRLAHDVENIVGIKESSGDITFTSELIRRNSDVDFKVFAGRDTVIYPTLALGGDGAVCSTANMFTELVSSIYDKYVEGDHEGSLEAQFKLNPIRLSQDAATFPAATKDMSNLMGLDIGESIRPTTKSEGTVLELMRTEMTLAGFLKDDDLK